MSDQPDSLVLRYLRRLDERQEAIAVDLKDVKTRLGSVEEQVSLIRTDIVHIQHRLDRIDDRVSRIEKRLDLIQV
jgi:hypothetical protein